jgi:hypothetical protein
VSPPSHAPTTCPIADRDHTKVDRKTKLSLIV